MQKPNLHLIKKTDSKVIAQINSSELKGLWIDPETLNDEENLCGQLIKDYKSEIMDMCRLAYSLGDCYYIEVTFRIDSKEDSNCNIHIHQELSLFEESNELRFECPLSEDYLKCETLYLRADYPLFGSAEFLNIQSE
jgi:hypothetical protein